MSALKSFAVDYERQEFVVRYPLHDIMTNVTIPFKEIPLEVADQIESIQTFAQSLVDAKLSPKEEPKS